MANSCSFRITRTAEDLAQTITALSQRLVQLEQRQEAIELKLQEDQSEIPAEELEMLDGVENLLKECQDLLDSSAIREKYSWSENNDLSDGLKNTLEWVDNNLELLEKLPWSYSHKS